MQFHPYLKMAGILEQWNTGMLGLDRRKDLTEWFGFFQNSIIDGSKMSKKQRKCHAEPCADLVLVLVQHLTKSRP